MDVPTLSGGKPVSTDMTIWEVMGQRRFRELLEGPHFVGASGILAVADVTRRQTLDALYEWTDPPRRRRVVRGPRRHRGERGGMAKAVQPSGLDVARALHGGCVLTSTKTGTGVEEAFRTHGTGITGAFDPP